MIKKKYLFFIVHPSKYYLFRKTINDLIHLGNEVDIVIITKDVLEELVKSEGWVYYNIFPNGRKIKFLPVKLTALFSALLSVIKLFYFILKKNIKYDVFITDDILVIPGFILNIKTYFFVDNDIKTLSLIKYLLPFTDFIIAPESTDLGNYNNKKISFKGNKAIAHLHPKYFIADKKYVKCKNQFFLIRIAKLNAVHDDINNSGINDINLKKLIELLIPHGDILISAERKLPYEFEKYRLNINPSLVSHYINFCKIFITDSGTMATEAAVLGRPNILLNNLAEKCGVHVELKKIYKLQYYYNSFDQLFDKVKVLLSTKNIESEWEKNRKLFIDDVDDLPDFLLNVFK